MNAARTLRTARRRARLTQRELAERAGVPQPAVARIEAGRVTPRLDTFERLLRVCGLTLEAHHRPGEGVDRTLIRQMLEMSPDERVKAAAAGSRALSRLRAAVKR